MAREASASAAEKKKLQNEKKKLKSERKEQKKLAKKRAKEIAAQEAELAEDEEGGGFFTFLATLAIIAVWIAILCVVIKLDVGGFGTNVLTPILKDVPIVNKVLPNSKTEEEPDSEDNNSAYADIGEATEQIKSLELQLQEAQSQNLAMQEENANLRATIARLEEFEDKQVEFQRIQTEFFRDVVYAENGPGLEEYAKYYEAMDPTTAEYIYRQVVEQIQQDSQIRQFAATYSGMKPAKAAAIFEAMQDDLNQVAKILGAMTPEQRAAILENMSTDVAAKLTKIMNPES